MMPRTMSNTTQTAVSKFISKEFDEWNKKISQCMSPRVPSMRIAVIGSSSEPCAGESEGDAEVGNDGVGTDSDEAVLRKWIHCDK